MSSQQNGEQADIEKTTSTDLKLSPQLEEFLKTASPYEITRYSTRQLLKGKWTIEMHNFVLEYCRKRNSTSIKYSEDGRMKYLELVEDGELRADKMVNLIGQQMPITKIEDVSE